jgi:hypothetical protein
MSSRRSWSLSHTSVLVRPRTVRRLRLPSGRSRGTRTRPEPTVRLLIWLLSKRSRPRCGLDLVGGTRFELVTSSVSGCRWSVSDSDFRRVTRQSALNKSWHLPCISPYCPGRPRATVGPLLGPHCCQSDLPERENSTKRAPARPDLPVCCRPLQGSIEPLHRRQVEALNRSEGTSRPRSAEASTL